MKDLEFSEKKEQIRRVLREQNKHFLSKEELSQWLHFEAQLAKADLGENPETSSNPQSLSSTSSETTIETQDPNLKSILYRSSDFNFRRAEATSMISQVGPLQSLRTQISRGKLEEAQALLEVLYEEAPQDQKEYISELMLEKARLAAFSGVWSQARQFATLGLQQHPASITRLTLLQVRSVALFELGELWKSMEDIESLESLRSLYPSSHLHVYSSLLKIKILARVDSMSAAQKELAALWKKVKQNSDILISLLRTEMDLARLNGQRVDLWAMAACRLAEAQGDRLYLGLSLVDLFFAVKKESQESLELLLQDFKQNYPRVRTLIEEIEDSSRESRSLTAQSIAIGSQRDNTSLQEKISYSDVLRVETLVFSNQQLAVRIKEDNSLLIKRNINRKQLIDGVTLLSQGPIQKKNLFEKLWSLKYSPLLHDGLIRTLLSRIRKDLNVKVLSKQDSIFLEDCMVIGG